MGMFEESLNHVFEEVLMKHLILAGALSFLTVPVLAQAQTSPATAADVQAAQAEEYQLMMSGQLYDNENANMSVDPNAVLDESLGVHGGGPGGHVGGGGRVGQPGGSYGHAPTPIGHTGGDYGHTPIGHSGDYGHSGHAGEGYGHAGHPGDYGHSGRGERFPGRGEWGHERGWWRGEWGFGWYVHYNWWPGFYYYSGACFAEDNAGYLFAGPNVSSSVYNCSANSPVRGCVFVGCD